jgi:hypothetical protein
MEAQQYWEYSREHGWAVRDRIMAVSVCPGCYGPVYRVPRRVIDRLISLVSPRHRYECRSPDCCWEGTLPDEYE